MLGIARATAVDYLARPRTVSSLGKKPPQQRYYSPRRALLHADVGITEYLRPDSLQLSGFPGRLRDRKRDFQVREITPDGEVLKLTGPLWTKRMASELPESFPKNGMLGDSKFDTWPHDRPDYLHFRLHQEGLGTQEAVAMIARCIGRPPRSMRVAGMKDRRSLSTQRVSAFRLRRSTLRRAVLHPMWDNRVRFSNLEYRAGPIQLGDLSGNNFDLVLRGLPEEFVTPPSRAIIERALDALSVHGFLNYFGLQRFGTQEICAHHIGAALLSGEWSRAVDLILGDAKDLLHIASGAAPRPGGRAPTATVRAIRRLPQHLFIERELLCGIADGLPPQAALRRLPWNVLFMYLNSAQSLLFNKMLSRRMQLFGADPVADDLCMRSTSKDVFGLSRGPAALGADLDQLGPAPLQHVVLPMPGRSVVYPRHLKDDYAAACQETFDLPLDIFHNGACMPLDGTYRHLAVVPRTIDWRIMEPGEVATLGNRLLLSDVDKLYESERNLPPMPPLPKATDQDAALILSCALPPSAYVTMAVRELTRGQATVWQADTTEERPLSLREVSSPATHVPVDDALL